MNVVVFCGSNNGNDPRYLLAAQTLGAWIGSHGHRLIYGGSKTGLMGALADATLAAGGEVIGVETFFFGKAGIAHEALTQLVLVETLAERKSRMIELGDAFVALPGGIGTLDEVTDVATAAHLQMGGVEEKPCIMLDIDGYYQPFREMLDRMVNEGFLPRRDTPLVEFADDVDMLTRMLSEA